MNNSLIEIVGNIDKILNEEENGAATVLFKINPKSKRLNSTITMVYITKKQWDNFKDQTKKLEFSYRIVGEYDIRLTKDHKPYLYVRCCRISRLKEQAEKDMITHVNNIKRSLLKEEQAEDKNRWFDKIPEEEFIKIDINKVKLVEEVHLNSSITKYNIRTFRKFEELTPIAVRKLENGEYGLVSGIISYIVAKILSRDVKAYITDLNREEFKKKYDLYI